jgi:hypothetical protein
VTLAVLLPYALYLYSAQGGGERFLLPAHPFLAIAVAQGAFTIVDWLGERWPTQKWAAAVLVPLLLLAPGVATLPNQAASLDFRNFEARSVLAETQQVVAGTPPDSVFVTSTFNDTLIVYSRRSALNQVMLPKPDPRAGAYQMPEAEGRLLDAVERIMAKGLPLYIEERETMAPPPMMDVYGILSKHYALERHPAPSSFYRVVGKRP